MLLTALLLTSCFEEVEEEQPLVLGEITFDTHIPYNSPLKVSSYAYARADNGDLVFRLDLRNTSADTIYSTFMYTRVTNAKDRGEYKAVNGSLDARYTTIEPYGSYSMYFHQIKVFYETAKVTITSCSTSIYGDYRVPRVSVYSDQVVQEDGVVNFSCVAMNDSSEVFAGGMYAYFDFYSDDMTYLGSSIASGGEGTEPGKGATISGQKHIKKDVAHYKITAVHGSVNKF